MMNHFRPKYPHDEYRKNASVKTDMWLCKIGKLEKVQAAHMVVKVIILH